MEKSEAISAKRVGEDWEQAGVRGVFDAKCSSHRSQSVAIFATALSLLPATR